MATGAWVCDNPPESVKVEISGNTLGTFVSPLGIKIKSPLGSFILYIIFDWKVVKIHGKHFFRNS